MRNKMIAIIGAIIVLFGALYFVIDYKNKQATDGSNNPYGKTNLDQATIDQLDDPLYQNQIIPEDLEEKLSNEENVVVYFYSPTCIYCQNTTPVLMPIAEELNVDVKQFNLLEFESDSKTYNIETTPTLVFYEQGIEVDRINGEQSEEIFRAFFNEYVVNE